MCAGVEVSFDKAWDKPRHSRPYEAVVLAWRCWRKRTSCGAINELWVTVVPTNVTGSLVELDEQPTLHGVLPAQAASAEARARIFE
jgi:hypothetical protein